MEKNKIEVLRCKGCRRFLLKNRASNSIESLIRNDLKKMFSAPEIKSMNFRVNDDKIVVSLKIVKDGTQKSEERIVPLKIRNITCKFCAMKHTKYYNAIIQIRAPDELHDQIQRKIEKMVSANKTDRLAFISTIEKQKRGFDVYIGSKTVAHPIAKKIKNEYVRKNYKVKKKISHKLGGRREGRNLYRDTILISIEKK